MAAPLLKLARAAAGSFDPGRPGARRPWPPRCPRWPRPDAIEIVAIRTTGDAIQDRPCRRRAQRPVRQEIEEALLARRIDCRGPQHEGHADGTPPGLVIAAFLPREDARDVLIAGDVRRIADLRQGRHRRHLALAGRAQLLHRRPGPADRQLRGTSRRASARRAAGTVERRCWRWPN